VSFLAGLARYGVIQVTGWSIGHAARNWRKAGLRVRALGRVG